MARGWIPRRWFGVALTAVWVGMVGSVAAQGVPASAPQADAAAPSTAPASPPPGPGAAMGGCFMGLPCPPPGMMPYPCPCPPVCEGPTDNTQFDTPTYHVSFDYLYWYPRKSSLPPLVTSGTSTAAMPAALLQPGTRVLLQGTRLEDDQLQGGRLTFGIGVDSSNQYSLVLSAFLLEEGQKAISFGNQGTTAVLARPFFNTQIGLEDAERFAGPGLSGMLTVSQTRRFYGGDADLRYEYLCSDNHRIHLLGGAKLLFLDESLNFERMSVGPVAGVRYQTESLGVANRFYGGQLGAEWEFRLGPVFFLTKGKLAFGVVDVNPNLSSVTQFIDPTGAVTTGANQGLYVSPTSAGRSHRSQFALAPELNFKLGFDFNEWVRFSVGYTYVGLTDATRAGDLINRNSNPATNLQPAPLVNLAPQTAAPTTGFWAQGLDVSVRLSF